ncbi:MAG: MATE family efflux transporter [Peptococcaceae bacterium]|nr:MATE family efflux transporter [Peptococcaceae bacterium]
MQESKLLTGSITKSLLIFALPMIAGNLLQQCYNIADTIIVGQFLGANALAAVGSSYTLMTFLTSIILGLCMGSGASFSISFGREQYDRLKTGIFQSFVFIGIVAVAINVLVMIGINFIIWFLRVGDANVAALMKDYLLVIFLGILATFLQNYFSCLLRALGNSKVPLLFLAVSALLNIALDLLFVCVFHWGVAGAAFATILSQWVSGIGLALYTFAAFADLRPSRAHMHWDRAIFHEITSFSFLTCIQQSVMNFGILMVQGLVNSFGPVIMAAFAAAVKIDSFAYMPVQDFGNAFSTFIAQNYGAKKEERIRQGIRTAFITASVFSIAVSAIVFIFAEPLMTIFIDASETDIIAAGVLYLRVEGAFYVGIGILFLLYGLYRAIARPGMSVVLTIISLGTRVALAYALSAIPAIGVTGIWASVPIGWALADIVGIWYWRRLSKRGEALL